MGTIYKRGERREAVHKPHRWQVAPPVDRRLASLARRRIVSRSGAADVPERLKRGGAGC